MVKRVSDSSANRRDKIANAAEVLKKSNRKKKVFEAVYGGKKNKTVSEIMDIVKMDRVRTNQDLGKLEAEDMIKRLEKKQGKEFVYQKINFYSKNKQQIMRLANNSKSLSSFHTKTNPKVNVENIKVDIRLPSKNFLPKINFIAIDNIDQFKGIEKIEDTGKRDFYENKIKDKFKKIIEERGKFTDWGGEKNDLFTTMIKINEKRFPVAFAFKGKGTSGILTPKKLGKNGDQIQRLFESPAEVFFIQYVNQIDQSVLKQMEVFAQVTSIHKNKKIYYGIIDGIDTNKVMQL